MTDSVVPAQQPNVIESRTAARSSEPNVAATTDAPSHVQRGIALPGDRGPRSHSAPASYSEAQTHASVEPTPKPTRNQRPSFWRRIALGGRRASETGNNPVAAESSANTPTAQSARGLQNASATPATSPASVEQRIVEPLLQSLVSIESKLERSHVDLSQRSDQVEQRLTQLWDIEEQLGTLTELQESLLHVSEQQRRLATATENQTRMLRWLIGSIFFSLAAAAFVVAAVLR